MWSLNRFHALFRLLVLSPLLVHAWSASGIVRTISGAPLTDVRISTLDQPATILATTGTSGTFSIDVPTGITGSFPASPAAVRWIGSRIEIATLGTGLVRIQLLDFAGRTIRNHLAVPVDGKVRLDAPSVGPGSVFLRFEQDGVVTVHRLPFTRIAAHGPAAAARGLATPRVLLFRRDGYRDTTYALSAEESSGLEIRMQPVGAPVACPSPALRPGSQTRTITVKGVQRSYILHVPSTYNGSTAVPLVVDFHPIGGSGSGQLSGTRYRAVTDPEGVISAYPNGLQGPMGGAWNVGGCCVAGADDTAFARALVADVRSIACIDSRRVYAVGFSMGGGMSHFAACHLADLFAAVAPAAFDLLRENLDTCRPSRPITVVSFRGTNDRVVPYAGGHSAVVSGMAINFLGATETFETWARLNGCTGSPSASDGQGCSTYSSCRDGVQVTLCTRQGGGHDQGDASVGWPILRRYTLP